MNNDKHNEKLSAFIDDELTDGHDGICNSLSDDEATRDTWQRYHVIRDVLRQNYHQDSLKLHEKVADSLESEPAILAPKKKTFASKVYRQVAGLAVAATVAAVAVIVARFEPQTDTIDLAAEVGPITQQPVRLTTAAEKKLSGYIVNHNEYAASSKYKSVIPYTTIISYTPGKHVSY